MVAADFLSASPQALTAALVVVGLSCVLWVLLRRPSGAADVSPALKRPENASRADGDERVLQPIKFTPFVVRSNTQVNHNTRLLSFEIEEAKRGLGLPIGRHVTVCAVIDGARTLRPYTPTSPPEQCGHFDLLVKVYRDGKMSQHLGALTPGDTLDVRGPTGRFKYEANNFEHLLLVGAGSGLTPLLQLARHILVDEADDTRLTLVYQNRTEADILLREELDLLAHQYPEAFTVVYCLSKAPKGWGKRKHEHTGYVTAEVLGSPCYACVCGPSGFTDFVIETLAEQGLEGEASVHVF